ncbi:hypothetical protein [Cupriavidus basilensis]|uniref:hypothetical protein n=1 Tax=Cupriavidus basilensis TaxID=68895 RepID=UPI0020A65B75|nr:hypothetical protein [Cupriavidus basilensis]MCP3025249.1 hypothetical protein [Cupriavidus basilensis]
MGLAIAGVIANAICTLYFLSSEYVEGGGTVMDVVAAVLGTLLAISVLGLILAGTGKKKLGGALVMIGSIPFVPLGLIGVIGGRKMIQPDPHAHDLDARRQAAAALASSSADSSRGE